ALLLAIQWGLTFLMARSDAVERLVKSSPRLLVYRGEYLDRNIRDERLTRTEVLAALRENGLTDVKAAEAVVLETDASFSVISRDHADLSPAGLAQSVRGVPGQD
ncbi:MAG: DUF421 domain-containing protein, partial [Hyphomonas sp.]|nr:DUF421 domain-containing protein [Hyphomonas sp.]